MLIDPAKSRTRTPTRGLSIVELMVGIAVGMFVLAGASLVTSSQLSDNRKLLLETQVQQDLRAAMDIIVRDVKRSGYWTNAYKSVAPETGPAVNPYSPAGALALGSSEVLAYTTSRDEDSFHAETGGVESNEQNGFGYKVSGMDTIDVKLGSGNYQALTDPSVVRITGFSATVTSTPVDLSVCSTPPCAMTAAASPLNAACGGMARLLVRSVFLRIDGEAVHDPSVKRSVVSTVRLRNDQVCQ